MWAPSSSVLAQGSAGSSPTCCEVTNRHTSEPLQNPQCPLALAGASAVCRRRQIARICSASGPAQSRSKPIRPAPCDSMAKIVPGPTRSPLNVCPRQSLIRFTPPALALAAMAADSRTATFPSRCTPSATGVLADPAISQSADRSAQLAFSPKLGQRSIQFSWLLATAYREWHWAPSPAQAPVPVGQAMMEHRATVPVFVLAAHEDLVYQGGLQWSIRRNSFVLRELVGGPVDQRKRIAYTN